MAPFGNITSPDLDGDGFHDYNLNCNWTVQAEQNHVIEFHVFVDLHYFPSLHCVDSDYLKVRFTRTGQKLPSNSLILSFC